MKIPLVPYLSVNASNLRIVFSDANRSIRGLPSLSQSQYPSIAPSTEAIVAINAKNRLPGTVPSVITIGKNNVSGGIGLIIASVKMRIIRPMSPNPSRN